MTSTTPKNWIAVTSVDPARRGPDEMAPGFLQVGHGRLVPLKRGQPGEPYASDVGGFMPHAMTRMHLYY